MIVMFVTMDNQGHCRSFSCRVPQIESAFDVISDLVNQGARLVSVKLLDPTTAHRTILPVEAFAGELIRLHIEKLVIEWQPLLSTPIHPELTQQQLLTAYSKRLLGTYQTRIIQIERAIADINARIHQTPLTAHWDLCHVRLTTQLTRYQGQMDRAQTGHRRIVKRLSQYLDIE